MQTTDWPLFLSLKGLFHLSKLYGFSQIPDLWKTTSEQRHKMLREPFTIEDCLELMGHIIRKLHMKIFESVQFNHIVIGLQALYVLVVA